MDEPLISAAEYVRMSTEDQKYSIANQKAAIADFAAANGYRIVSSFSDAGISGLDLKHRPGLQALINAVVSGAASFSTVLVLDVSRWGRFQDVDESAYYEFLCRQSGVTVQYCAEAFVNDLTPYSNLVKAIKRTMAAEYRRGLPHSGTNRAAGRRSACGGS
jgi:DNA invertase Pin-like site-specific DNA recombinase